MAVAELACCMVAGCLLETGNVEDSGRDMCDNRCTDDTAVEYACLHDAWLRQCDFRFTLLVGTVSGDDVTLASSEHLVFILPSESENFMEDFTLKSRTVVGETGMDFTDVTPDWLVHGMGVADVVTDDVTCAVTVTEERAGAD